MLDVADEPLTVDCENRQGWKLSDAGQRFVADNMGLVYREAHKLRKQGVLSFDELVGEGGLALARCARTYGASKGTVATYSIPSIQRQMWRAIQDRRADSLPQEPERRYEGDNPHAQGIDTIPAPETDEQEIDRLPFDPADFLAGLNELERMVVRWRLGMQDGRPKTMRLVAKKINHPVAVTWQIYKRAVWRMKLAASRVGGDGEGVSNES
jgi:DNA-directed RNA polymerase sigma subunit (sigma70/sigma32)